MIDWMNSIKSFVFYQLEMIYEVLIRQKMKDQTL